jgi:hypothetical protein
MKPIGPWLQVGVFLVALFTRTEGLASRPAPSSESSKPAAGAASEYRQFDFWVGDWDAFDVENPDNVGGATE